MKLIALILLVTGGYFFVQDMNDSGSNYSSHYQSGGGPDIGNYGRPDVSIYENRGGASCTIGRSNVPVDGQYLSKAHRQTQIAYQTFVDYQKSFGPYDSRTIQAQERYYQAKAQLDTLKGMGR